MAPAMIPADPPFPLSGWHRGGGYPLPGGWHVGGIGMGWGECPEFVCLGEGQGVSSGFMIHHPFCWGIFTPWPSVMPLGQRGFLCQPTPWIGWASSLGLAQQGPSGCSGWAESEGASSAISSSFQTCKLPFAVARSADVRDVGGGVLQECFLAVRDGMALGSDCGGGSQVGEVYWMGSAL